MNINIDKSALLEFYRVSQVDIKCLDFEYFEFTESAANQIQHLIRHRTVVKLKVLHRSMGL